MKIWLRLTLGFGLIILLMLTISGTAAWRMTDTQTSNHLLQDSQATTALVLELSRYVDVNANQTEALTRITNFGDIKEFQQRFDTSLNRINELFEELGKIQLSEQAQPFYEDLLKARAEYNVHRDKILGYVAEGNIMEVIADEKLPGLLNNYMVKINNMVEHQREATTMLFDESNEEGEIGLLILGVITALALVLGPIWALVVTRSISLPLANTVTVAQSVARRDLTQSLKPHGHDEIATLEQSLSEMVTGLQQAVGEIRQGSEAIESAASEISAGNLDLSTRTEQQASSLAETAASMEQITSTVRQSGDNAQQANGLAQAAAQTAHEGEAVVSELVAIMNDVNSKAQQIADIIAVIDSIAFQTNILALNAAVEAARAGEQGRGFAVVASEVRALAQRSAASAREIGELIGSSVEVISQGAEQTDKAGASMQQINNSITKVADIIGEINAASKEQIIGIEQINTAISQMDEATRSNATLVEESAAASSSLQEQTAALNRLVASFRLNSASGASKAQPKPKSQTKEATIKQAQPKTRDITPKAPALEHKTAPKHDDWTEF